MTSTGRLVFGLVLSLLAVTGPVGAQTGATVEHWVGTWATAAVSAPSEPPPQPPNGLPAPPLRFNNQTFRQFVRISIGGERVRVVLTNAFGTRALTIDGAHLARRGSGAAIAAGSDRALTFGGLQTATIPPGAVLVSDPVNLSVPDSSDVAIDLFFPGDTAASPSPLTVHSGSRQTNYLSGPGKHLGAAELPGATAVPAWAFLARLEVVAPDRVGAVVALGDSITDGFNSTPDTNNRWPDHLAKRLASAGSRMGVLNVGIDGNRVLVDGAGISALARFDREVLAQPGATHVFVLEGINDLGIGALFMDGPRPTTEELIAGHRQLIARAHAQGPEDRRGDAAPLRGDHVPRLLHAGRRSDSAGVQPLASDRERKTTASSISMR